MRRLHIETLFNLPADRRKDDRMSQRQVQRRKRFYSRRSLVSGIHGGGASAPTSSPVSPGFLGWADWVIFAAGAASAILDRATQTLLGDEVAAEFFLRRRKYVGNTFFNNIMRNTERGTTGAWGESAECSNVAGRTPTKLIGHLCGGHSPCHRYCKSNSPAHSFPFVFYCPIPII